MGWGCPGSPKARHMPSPGGARWGPGPHLIWRDKGPSLSWHKDEAATTPHPSMEKGDRGDKGKDALPGTAAE